MRVHTTITDMNPDQWETAQNIIRPGYDIPDGATRVCLILHHEDVERHMQLPLGSYIGLLGALGMDGMLDGLRTAMAALTPDALPEDPRAGQWDGI